MQREHAEDMNYIGRFWDDTNRNAADMEDSFEYMEGY